MAAPVTTAWAASPELPRRLDDLSAIEGELAKLWQGRAAENAAGSAVLRAATYTLVTIVPDETDSQGAASMLATLMGEQPGRVVIAWVRPDAAGEDARAMSAWVSSHCRQLGRGTQVCGEQIMIEAGSGALARLPSVVEALVLPDCPALLWWRGGPGPAAAVLDRLSARLDAWLLDGARFRVAELVPFARRAVRHGRSLPVGDLSWWRSAAWRRWTAECYDPPDWVSAVRGIRGVDIETGTDSLTDGLLYAAWLSVRLGWTAPTPGRQAPLPERRGGWQAELRGFGGPVTVTIRAASDRPGLSRVRLDSPGERRRVSLARGEGLVAIETAREAAPPHGRTVRHVEPDQVALVGNWLGAARRDGLYEQVLDALPALVGAS
jgi:hypothetical protein